MKDQESEKVPILQDDSRSNPKYDSNMPTTSTAQLSISEENKTPSKTVHKKKQPTFLKRHIIVTNPGEVDDVELLQSMNERFTKNCETWIRKAKIFRIAHFIVVLIVILLQLSQVILLQLPISTYVQHQLATILPAITGALLGIQLKLAWSEKGIKCKKCAKLFSMLANHTKFRLEMHKAGGRSSDIETIKLWNHALLAEIEDVTVLEMKELNERQKADHATRMYQQLKSSLDQLQNRNSELETKFAELTKLNLAAQQTERELRDELAEVVPKVVSDADRKKIDQLQEELAKTKVKMSKLQDLSDISHNQLQSVQSQQLAREREMKSLRQQLREFQVQTDENALIGQLHHQILILQSSEADTQKKLTIAQKNVQKLEAHTIRLEKQIDEKEDSVYLTRAEANNKSRQLKKTIQSLRQQFSGALPLAQQEKFSQAMTRLQQDKLLIQEELRRTRMDRERIEDELEEARIQKQGLDELRQAIEDKRGADKLTEWSNRMDKLRLQDMKLQRQVVRQNEQLKYLENLSNQHERTISSLEEDIVQMLKAQENHQVEWEMREMELERLLDQFQSQSREVSKKTKRLEDITQTLPDPSLPVDVQLTKALETIKEQMKIINSTQGQIRGLQYENERLKDLRHNLESDITSRDRIITDMRLHMPTTTTVAREATQIDTESKQQLRVAMETIETFKKRLAAKEESIERYKQLLEESRKEQESAASFHEKELMKMQQKMQEKTDGAFSRFKMAAVGAASPSRSQAPTTDQLAHLNELEDMVKEQDAAMSALMDRVRAANADVVKQKRIIADLRRQSDDEKNKLVEEHDKLLHSIRLKLAKKHRRVEGLEKEMSVLTEELEREKEANSRAPVQTMKKLVSRLKVQLEEKEKQQQKLSLALTELRSDLVSQAQENVRAHSAEEEDAGNVKVLVDRRTAHYKIQIEELKDKIAELQRGVKQAKKAEETLHGELRKTLEEVEKKEQTIKQLKMDHRSKDGDIKQLREKIKRLVKSRGPESGLKFADEQPIKLTPEEGRAKTVADEEVVVPVDATEDQTPRPSSGRSNIPRSKSTFHSTEAFNKLKSDLSRVKEENENLKEKLKYKTDETSKSAVELAKWDAKKQWQGRVDQLKTKLQDKDKHIQLLEKQSTHLRDTISRLERDKLRKSVHPIGPPIHAQGTGESDVPPESHAIRQHLHNIEQLSRRVHELGEENKELKRMEVLPRNKMAAEMEARNQQLSEKLEELQKEMMSSGIHSKTDDDNQEWYRTRENELQGRILKLSSENTELRFEVEQVKLELPRLKERLEYQQQYIDLLQSEKKEVHQKLDKVKGQQKKSTGVSGKSVTELEKTVALMKKVVERVQRENDELKRAPGVVSNQRLDELKNENHQLKARLHEVTQQVGGQLSMRYESKTQSVERLMKENERLRREAEKHASEKKKYFNSKISHQTEKERLSHELEEMRKKLAIAEGKAPKMAGSGSRGYNSAVTAKMFESKLKKTEVEVEKKSSEVNALKALLAEKSTSEEQLREDNERLHEQIEILERFPPGAGKSDLDTVRELQIARLTIARLENEKEELRHGMVKRDQPTPGKAAKADDVTLRAENLRLETEMQMMKEQNKRVEEENRKMKEELSHFDGDFFDEIEDLKYNYAESVKKNVLYEDKLRALSHQFGVDVDLPSPDE